MSATRTQMSLAFLALLIISHAAVADESLDAFWAAARSGDLATIERLVGDGVDINAGTQYGATALSFACDKGHLAVV